MSKAERAVYLFAGILFAWMGLGGIAIVVALIVYAEWPVILFGVPFMLFPVAAVSFCAWEAINTFRTGRL